jgi:hypothetical protein
LQNFCFKTMPLTRSRKNKKPTILSQNPKSNGRRTLSRRSFVPLVNCVRHASITKDVLKPGAFAVWRAHITRDIPDYAMRSEISNAWPPIYTLVRNLLKTNEQNPPIDKICPGGPNRNCVYITIV